MLLAASIGAGGFIFGLVVLAILVGILVVVYFVPTIYVRGMDYPVRRKVFWLNLLLGWTLVGWVIALRTGWQEKNRLLIEALSADRSAGRRRGPAWSASSARPALAQGDFDPGHPVAGWYDDPLGDGERWWDGNAWTEQVRPRGM